MLVKGAPNSDFSPQCWGHTIVYSSDNISFNSLASGKCSCKLEWMIFKHISKIDHVPWNCPHMNTTIPPWWSVNIGPGYGLVALGSKPLMAYCLTSQSQINLNQCWPSSMTLPLDNNEYELDPIEITSMECGYMLCCQKMQIKSKVCHELTWFKASVL